MVSKILKYISNLTNYKECFQITIELDFWDGIEHKFSQIDRLAIQTRFNDEIDIISDTRASINTTIK